jgi:hypothetical protein
VSVGLWKASHNGAVQTLAIALVAIDAAQMLVPMFGYAQLSAHWTVWAALAYLLVLTAIAVPLWRGRPESWRDPDIVPAVRFGLLLFFKVSVADAVLVDGPDYGLALFTLVCAVLLVAVHVADWDKPVLGYRVLEFATTLLAAGGFWAQDWLGEPSGFSLAEALRLVATAVMVVMFVIRVRLVAAANAKALREHVPAPPNQIEAVGAFCVNVLVVALCDNIWDGFDFGYPASLVCMCTALFVIALGFWSRAGSLRLYGLVVTICCVLKLVTLDVGSIDTLMRVVAFIGGGLICFGISALYNFAVKQFEKES